MITMCKNLSIRYTGSRLARSIKSLYTIWDYRRKQYAKYQAAGCYSCLEKCDGNCEGM
jgi:hypothetical protein